MMWRFILMTFAFLGWSFYSLSGGADYYPREGSRQASALKAEAEGKLASLSPQVTAKATVTTDIADNPTVSRSDTDLPSITPNLLSLDTTKLLAPRPAGTADQTQPEPAMADARIANLSLAQPAAFAQAAGYAPTSLEQAPDSLPDDAVAGQMPDLRQITGTRVNMRAGPGTGYTVVTSLLRDTEVEVLEQGANGWLRLRVLNDSTTGWVSSRLVTAALQ